MLKVPHHILRVVNRFMLIFCTKHGFSNLFFFFFLTTISLLESWGGCRSLAACGWRRGGPLNDRGSIWVFLGLVHCSRVPQWYSGYILAPPSLLEVFLCLHWGLNQNPSASQPSSLQTELLPPPTCLYRYLFVPSLPGKEPDLNLSSFR